MLGIMSGLSQRFVLGSFAGSQDIPFQNIDLSLITSHLVGSDVQECLDPTDFLHDMETYV